MFRLRYAPEIPIAEVPASMHVKSVYNITRERAWGPLHQKELANIRNNWDEGRIATGYHASNPLHE